MEYNYAQELRRTMEIEKYDGEYIELCCSYAQRLCDNKLPVIFDFYTLVTIVRL